MKLVRNTHPLFLAAAVSVLLFSLIGTAAVMGWLPGSNAEEGTQQSASEKSKPPVQLFKSSTRGVVEGVREVKVKGEGTGLGAVAGGVTGGIVGNQIGGGRGKDAMTVVGVVGGGIAGHEIEKNVRATTNYVVDVKFDDGSRRAFTYGNPPGVRSGDRVKLVDGALQRA